jgi:hypothetical protein
MENGKIYIIKSYNNDLCYIGSTNKSLKYRLCKHKTDYKRWVRGVSSYYTCFYLFNLYGIDNINISLVEDNIKNIDLHNRETII